MDASHEIPNKPGKSLTAEEIKKLTGRCGPASSASPEEQIGCTERAENTPDVIAGIPTGLSNDEIREGVEMATEDLQAPDVRRMQDAAHEAMRRDWEQEGERALDSIYELLGRFPQLSNRLVRSASEVGDEASERDFENERVLLRLVLRAKRELQYSEADLAALCESIDASGTYYTPSVGPDGREAVLRLVSEYTALDYPMTKMSVVEAFLGLHGHEVRYCRDEKATYGYRDGIWRKNKYDYVERLAFDFIRNLREVAKNIADEKVRNAAKKMQTEYENQDIESQVARRIRSQQIEIGKNGFDSNKWLLNLANGTYDLERDVLTAHDPKDYMTLMAPVSYDHGADCPFFKQMISDTFDGDLDVVAYVQRLLGYCLTGDTSIKRFFIFYGPSANNGKSTLLKVMKEVLGDIDGYFGLLHVETVTAKSKDDKNLGLVEFARKRIAAIDEITTGTVLDSGKVKAISGDTAGLIGRQLYETFQTIVVRSKMIIATNTLPEFDEIDSGVRDRATVIPFNHRFEKDSSIEQKWMAELPGILNWLIEGIRSYKTHGLDSLPAAIVDATNAYTGKLDPLGDWLRQYTVNNPSAPLRPMNLFYTLYSEWREKMGHHYISAKQFKKELVAKGYKVEQTGAANAGNSNVVYSLELMDGVV